jgi:hypothetical protein
LSTPLPPRKRDFFSYVVDVDVDVDVDDGGYI